MTTSNYVHLLVSVIHPEYEMTTNRYCVGFSLEDQHPITPPTELRPALAAAMRAVAALNTARDQQKIKQELLTTAAELEGS